MFDRVDRGMYWDKAWSIIEGCSPVSAGCRHCWAAQQTYVRSHQKNPKIKARYEGLNKDKTTFNGKIRLMDGKLDLPLRTRKPTVWSVWNDLFHKDVPDSFIDDVGRTIAKCPKHKFIILTKRPQRMTNYFKKIRYEIATNPPHEDLNMPNVWLGVSVENQKTADERIPILLQVPAAVRVVSYEPALEGLILPYPKRIDYIRKDGCWIIECSACGESFNTGQPGNGAGMRYCATEKDRWWDLHTGHRHGYNLNHVNVGDVALCTKRIDWVICGGETGPGARPMLYHWAQRVKNQCVEAGVPFFLKSHGEWETTLDCADPNRHPLLRCRGIFDKNTAWISDGEWDYRLKRVGNKQAGRLLDGRTWDEFPELSRG